MSRSDGLRFPASLAMRHPPTGEFAVLTELSFRRVAVVSGFAARCWCLYLFLPVIGRWRLRAAAVATCIAWC